MPHVKKRKPIMYDVVVGQAPRKKKKAQCMIKQLVSCVILEKDLIFY
ncbi:hypothetical protein HMPREF1015_03109 [Bacillus smithii 7_3_47FAA]|uniref:Uncharacterized protein n=1 Tax=Bacillus smithii 7_3_47FAA TaxID=665952 RepID=G9QHQ0_9BACI|nr:hypothetical protein HMPREF1015_03109 [Bacillus smithii 7_3_47FAA]